MIDVVMPKMGESITEGTIIEWKKKAGDRIELDEPLLEISTDKVDSELPSPGSGIIDEILFDINDVVAVGNVIARIRQEGDAEVDDGASQSAASSVESVPAKAESAAESEIKPPKEDKGAGVHKRGDGGFISPLVRSIMKKEGICADELGTISGSGNQNRITKKDILTYLENRKMSKPAAEPVSPPKQVTRIDAAKPQTDGVSDRETPFPADRRYPMDRVRKKIAEHMISSQQTSAHVYSTSEADVSNLVEIRLENKDSFKEKYGISLTYTPMIMYAVTQAVKEFPVMNSSIEDFDVISHQNINMGLAVALPDNNLIVPVIQRCEELNFLGMARQSASMAGKARSGQLTPEDIFGSTFTITNPGVFGGLTGMAIINQPNVGILSVGAFQKRPVVKETKYGDAIVIRSMVYLTLSYDHRLIDGAYGTRFLSRICELLEGLDESILR